MIKLYSNINAELLKRLIEHLKKKKGVINNHVDVTESYHIIEQPMA